MLARATGTWHIASVSWGKDSLAMLLKLIEFGLPLDEVVFFDTGMEFRAIYDTRDEVMPLLRRKGIHYTELHPKTPMWWSMFCRPVLKRGTGEVHKHGYGWCGGPCRWGTTEKQRDGRQQMGIGFFLAFTALDHVPRVAIENPVGVMSRLYRKPDQIINPWQFGDPYEKRTCLWLKGLPPLVPTNIVEPNPRIVYASGKTDPDWHSETRGLKGHARSVAMSKTFPGIAKAMASQWGRLEAE